MNSNTVEQSVAELDAAFNRRDLEAVLEIYEDDAVLMVEPGRSICGKDYLRGFFELFLNSNSTAKQEVIRVIPNGDIALFLSRWTLTTAVPDSDDERQQYVATSVFRKGVDGRWRLAIDNSFGPMILDC
ncbi:MAG TPA: SgcJ/EcaC family oxidoreductase [Dokdonella sp.]|uniref:YybH family protein n=1 Tax=Dokdonella sp. TaxID=2291710 RepID=UPI002D7EBAA1|nr:SgcJ/EcaC family oxidoreductase [Dokdonella sp.]HET9032914.1 SgcJ/EcaC family oxidoreductase [Dokdonella sp.]